MTTPPPFSSDDLLRVRRNPWFLGLAASPLLFVLAAIIAGLAIKAAFFAFVLHPLIIAGMALAYVWRRNPRPVAEPVKVRAGADGVDVGEEHIPREEIKSGFVLPGYPPKVKLRRRRALPVEIQVGSAAEGRALLRALGLDVSQTVSTFRSQSRALTKRRYLVSFVGVFVGLYAGFIGGLANARHHPGLGGVAGVVFVLGLLAALGVVLMPTWLDVGADGIALRWFGRKRFIGYGEIVDFYRYDKGWGRSRQIGLTINLRSGEQVPVPIGQPNWSEENVAIIEERMREAMESFRTGGGAAEAALLRRGDRPVGEWVNALRAIGSGANADMRTAPLPRERLFRIVESPTAGSAERAAAAVALGGDDMDDEARARLKGAAEACAAPKLRVVLEAAAGGSGEAEIEAALAEVAEEEARAKTG